METAPLTIRQAQERLRAGTLTAVELVEQCLAVADEFDSQLHAWVSIDATGARQAAAASDELRRRGAARGPLDGIPVGIKDIVDVAGWPTLAASPLRAGHRAKVDAPLVAQLRSGGAVILGKTVTTEWACFDPPPTRNPWNLQRTPGGSSSGSAAAVAAGMCLAAIGSQTGGSITRPAAYCGVVGFKPTLGRVCTAGLVPVSFHLDHPGPIASSVDDAALVLAAIADPDFADARLTSKFGDSESDVWQATAATPPRFGLLQGYFWQQAAEDVRQVCASATSQLAAQGADVTDVALPEEFDGVHRHHRTIMAVEAAAYHRSRYPKHRDQFGPQVASLLEEGVQTDARDYADALAHRMRFRAAFDRLLADFDAILMPATPNAAPGPETTGDPSFNSPWSYAGVPIVTLPCGLTDERMPVGLQLVAQSRAEAALLAAAIWCERQFAFNARPPLAALTDSASRVEL